MGKVSHKNLNKLDLGVFYITEDIGAKASFVAKVEQKHVRNVHDSIWGTACESAKGDSLCINPWPV